MKNWNSTRRATHGHRAGFTLLELLIVLGIILVIAAMVVPNLVGSAQTANEKATLATVKSAEKTTMMYAADHDAAYYIGSGQEAWQEFITPQDYRGKKLRPYYDEAPVDAWGNVLMYEWNGDGHSKLPNSIKPAIWSFGPNQQDDGGSGDDINNWTSAQVK